MEIQRVFNFMERHLGRRWSYSSQNWERIRKTILEKGKFHQLEAKILSGLGEN